MPEFLNPKARATARAAIVHSFADMPYPGDAAIPRDDTAYWHGIYGDTYEGSEIARLFTGKRWQDVDLDMLRHPPAGFQQGAFGFLSDEAVGYYAPALMLIALDHGRDADCFLDDAIYIFGHEFSRDPTALDRRVGRYTDGQKAAVAGFLQVMSDDDFEGDFSQRPQKLLETDWGRYLHPTE